jgi:hypothetical protein
MWTPPAYQGAGGLVAVGDGRAVISDDQLPLVIDVGNGPPLLPGSFDTGQVVEGALNNVRDPRLHLASHLALGGVGGGIPKPSKDLAVGRLGKDRPQGDRGDSEHACDWGDAHEGLPPFEFTLLPLGAKTRRCLPANALPLREN